MYNNALNAYKSVEKATVSGRETESRVLTEGAIKLRTCQKRWDENARAEMLDEALKYNQRIWTIFQTELGRKENPLPDHIKLDMLRLSSFIDKRIFEVMASPDARKVGYFNQNKREYRRGVKGPITYNNLLIF